MKYLLNFRSFISLMILFSFFDNFGMETAENFPSWEYDHLFKVVFVGDAKVGKTQIINKFVENEFSENYVETRVEYHHKTINSNGKIIKLRLWDTAGQEDYRAITQAYYKSGHLIVLVYAVDDKKSFENIQSWVEDVKNNTNGNPKFLLVGNKCDLEEERQVSREEAEKYAKDNGMKFFEVSAKTGTNINDDMFNSIIQDLLDNMEAEEKEKIQVKNPNKDNDDMFDSIIQNLFDDMETEEKKKENNNHTYNIYNDNKQGKLSFNGQNKDIIEINKNSCWSEY